MKLQDACECFLIHCKMERKLSPLTIRAYKADLAGFALIVGSTTSITDLSEAWIEKAIHCWSHNPDLKAVTIKRRIACVKVLVRWLFRRRQIEVNPFERIQVGIKVPHRLPRNLQTAEIRTLIASKPESMTMPKIGYTEASLSRVDWDRYTARLVIEVMTLTGIRVGELVKIQMSNMDDSLRQIRIVGKGNKERHVSFPDVVTVQRLQRYREFVVLKFGLGGSNSLFLNGLGRPANEQYVRRIVRQFAEAVQLTRRITPHMLRHTAATQLLEAGLDIRFVQKTLGHASITTTEKYTHVADHFLRTEIARANVRKRLELQR